MIKTKQELAQCTIQLQPRPSFVVKTRLSTSTLNPVREQGTKVFLNICTDDNVPTPEIAWSPEVVLPLIMENNWEIPIITSEERESRDKKGDLAYVYDCVIHSKCMRWCIQYPELRDILIEWCLESVELRSDGVSLDREKISRPKMTSKGDVPSLTVLKEDLQNSAQNRLNEEFERKLIDDKSPLTLLEAKRLDEEGRDMLDDSNEDVDIFNINRDPLASRPSTRPLIQEIKDMSLDSAPSSPKAEGVKASLITEILPQSNKKAPQIIKQKLKYETIMNKLPETHQYKLQITITSQITISLDYDLQFDTETSTLFLQCMNTREFDTHRDLEIPLPLGMTDIKSYFVKNEGLHVFVR
ncbi:hypothetical protein WICPIJ_009825 [Wickerhamomyces pijperi]|uniref:PIH1 N-terminal domain-containing protein n=1 Tax=Wickerhamomyces pijperi TaxID=599730 RepID=A0A9P8PL85_WICPI|nr:hypothetical protein WICPIJ_009825 [Wickerhamomyces pijperi]